VLTLARLPFSAAAVEETYPIPFVSIPDWHGSVKQYPRGPVVQLVPNSDLKGSLILIRASAQRNDLSSQDTAPLAYELLFVSNGQRSPGRGSFVVIDVYGQPDVHGVMAESAFVFHLGTNNRWEPRLISKPQLAAIKTALQQLAAPKVTSEVRRTYPIPFKKDADWQGFANTVPDTPFEVSTAHSRVLDHPLVLIQSTSLAAQSDVQMATYAYDAVFKNEKRLPHGAVFVVVNVYGPPLTYATGGSRPVFPKYGYIFARDSDNRWEPRLVSKEQLDALAKVLLPPRI